MLLSSGGGTKVADGHYKFFVRDLGLDPNKRYEVGLRNLLLTLEHPTDETLADLEFDAFFFLSCDLVKQKDTVIFATNAYHSANIIYAIDGSEEDSVLFSLDPFLATKKFKENQPYFTEMRHASNSDVHIRITSDGKAIDFVDGTNIVSFVEVVLEYREMK